MVIATWHSSFRACDRPFLAGDPQKGLIFGTSFDEGGGLWILKYKPGVKGPVSWTKDSREWSSRV